MGDRIFLRTIYKKSGFTLFETLLAVSVLVIVGAISAPVYQSFKTKSDLNNTAQITVSALRRASALSRGMHHDSTWGVLATTSQVIIFSGTNFASRNQALDESLDVLPSLSFSGQTEEVFHKLTGFPTSSGTLTITSPNGNTANISINSKGTISY